MMDGEVTELKDFAALCARGFGAFAHQRDDNWHTPLRYPSLDTSYYIKRLQKSEVELYRWQHLDEEQRYAEWSDYVAEQTISLHESKAKQAEQRARYEHMLAQVHGIEVPAMLQQFKDFMIEQLETSIAFDCRGTGSLHAVMPFVEWCASVDKKVLMDVDFYRSEVHKEQERHAQRVKYINAMVEAFGFEVEG